MKLSWNTEMEQMLVKIAEEDPTISYRDIAKKMTAMYGMTFTKNSLIGKGRRLGIPPRLSDTTPKRLKKKSTDDIIALLSGVPVPKKGEPVTIYQLRDGMCKWPSGKPFDRPPFMYCGNDTGHVGGSWCPVHRKVVFGRITSDSAKPSRPVW